MSHQLSPNHLFALSEIALFTRAQRLTYGDNLAEAVEDVKVNFDPTDWPVEIFKLGDDGRKVLALYGPYIYDNDATDDLVSELSDEFAQIEHAVDDHLAKICEELGVAELTLQLQRELLQQAETGRFKSDEEVYLEGVLRNPAIALWGEDEIKFQVETKVLSSMVWPEGYTPRSFDTVKVEISNDDQYVRVSVRVGEKIKG